ncbi:MAG: LON peptidase substrate-binding domain-containing protein, partial [Clostridia bacterium]|nr:LON peptidase substrate-binding domain-containing protein [Clostridia bacterium]
MSQYIEKIEKLMLPVIPLGDAVAFPPFPIDFESDNKNVQAAVDAAAATGLLVFLVADDANAEDEEYPENLYRVGTVAKIRQSINNDDGSVHLICECRARASVIEYRKTGKIATASLMCKEISLADNGGIRGEAYCRELRSALEEMLAFVGKASSAIRTEASKMDDPALLCDFIASAVLVRSSDKQAVLAEFDPFDRCALLVHILKEECDLMRYEHEIQEKARGRIVQGQREYYLREQLKIIEDELGMNNEDPDDCTAKIHSADLPDEVREKLLKENDRLSKTPFGSAEAAVLRNYIETVLELPWNKRTNDRVNVAAAKKILDADHDGLKKVKERILEYLAVKQLSPELKNQIICLVGPPGTGKTSIAASIASAMNRKYIRVSLGGIHDESDIRGHRKTYVASMPGRIMAAMEKV